MSDKNTVTDVAAQATAAATEAEPTYTAFLGAERVAAGAAVEVAEAAHRVSERPDGRQLLIFIDATGRQTDFDLSGTAADVAARYAPAPRPVGRPKLGVVGREVTLLPRHWEWLNAQPGGASVALRKLVEAARKETADTALVRSAQDAAYAVMTALAGDASGYEEAMRALYASDAEGFAQYTSEWPSDVLDYVLQLASPAFGSGDRG